MDRFSIAINKKPVAYAVGLYHPRALENFPPGGQLGKFVYDVCTAYNASGELAEIDKPLDKGSYIRFTEYPQRKFSNHLVIGKVVRGRLDADTENKKGWINKVGVELAHQEKNRDYTLWMDFFVPHGHSKISETAYEAQFSNKSDLADVLQDYYTNQSDIISTTFTPQPGPASDTPPFDPETVLRRVSEGGPIEPPSWPSTADLLILRRMSEGGRPQSRPGKTLTEGLLSQSRYRIKEIDENKFIIKKRWWLFWITHKQLDQRHRVMVTPTYESMEDAQAALNRIKADDHIKSLPKFKPRVVHEE